VVEVNKVHPVHITVVLTRDRPGVARVGAEQGAVGVVAGDPFDVAKAGVADLYAQRTTEVGEAHFIPFAIDLATAVDKDVGHCWGHFVTEEVVVSQCAVDAIDPAKEDRLKGVQALIVQVLAES